MDELLYTIADIQRIFKISRPTASKLVHSEGFPLLEGVGRRVLVPASALDEWIKKNTTSVNAFDELIKTCQEIASPFQESIDRAERLFKYFQL